MATITMTTQSCSVLRALVVALSSSHSSGYAMSNYCTIKLLTAVTLGGAYDGALTIGRRHSERKARAGLERSSGGLSMAMVFKSSTN